MSKNPAHNLTPRQINDMRNAEYVKKRNNMGTTATEGMDILILRQLTEVKHVELNTDQLYLFEYDNKLYTGILETKINATMYVFHSIARVITTTPFRAESDPTYDHVPIIITKFYKMPESYLKRDKTTGRGLKKYTKRRKYRNKLKRSYKKQKYRKH
jgi:hypothetical protein